MDRRNMLRTTAIAAGTVSLFPLDSTANKTRTPDNKKLKILVTGAHPDDPETNCGGTICRYVNEGHEVVVLYLTRGEAGIEGTSYEDAARIRTAEALEACRIMGARAVFAGQIDGNAVINESSYVVIADIIKNEAPDVIFTHWPLDTHRDHRICGNLVYDAWLRVARNATLYYTESLTGSQTQNFYPNTYIDISEVAEKKWEAAFVHTSQKIKEEVYDYHKQMELFRGFEKGCDRAEAFIYHTKNRGADVLKPGSI
jgi:LmbE family N-acetylglucosaminyl deacetylase